LEYCKPNQILGGIGSYKTGGRWSAIGSFRASYHSLTKAVALAEVDAHTRFYGFPKETLRPRLVVATESKLSRVLNLTAATIRKAPRVILDEIKKENWRFLQGLNREGLCQGLGRTTFLADAEALLTPSVQVKGGVNIVYFPENLLPTSSARIFRPDNFHLPSVRRQFFQPSSVLPQTRMQKHQNHLPMDRVDRIQIEGWIHLPASQFNKIQVRPH
jgi:RES domain-containing protein